MSRMGRPRVGAHTYLFTQYGWDQAERLDEIFDTVASAGFAAIELHRPMLQDAGSVARVRAAARRTGLGIVGASHALPLWDAARHDDILAEMDAHSDRLAELQQTFGRMQCGLSCTGKRLADRTDQEHACAMRTWRELGALFRRKGVGLAYHPHGEPIEDILAVIDGVPADLLSLGPDLDWLRVGGIDPDAFLRRHGRRITMMHLRDYIPGGRRTEALGEGEVDYASLRRLLDEIGFAGELVVELAVPPGMQPTRPALELLQQSRRHVRETMNL